MRTARILFGTLVLLVAVSATLAGVWVLRAAGGGGLDVNVAFNDTLNLSADDRVIYGDSVVGRVERVRDGVVTARIATIGLANLSMEALERLRLRFPDVVFRD